MQRDAEEAADRAGNKLSEAKGKAGKAAEEARDSAAGSWFGAKVRAQGANTYREERACYSLSLGCLPPTHAYWRAVKRFPERGN